MNLPLRIALALFSFSAMQTWVNLICGVLLVIGLAVGVFDLAGVAATFIVMTPAYGGGLVLRIVSSPTLLHLRPHGRRRMLLGATGTITLVALIWTLPVLVFQLTGQRMPNGYSVFDLPALGSFQFSWGVTALLWVGTFMTSRIQMVYAFSWLPFGVVVFLLGGLHLPADQRAQTIFALGAAAWAGFALWYMKTASIVRPGWVAGWLNSQSPIDFSQLSLRRWFNPAAADKAVSRPAALCLYLTGTRSILAQLLLGAVVTLVWAVAYQLYDRKGERLPVDYLMYLALFGATFTLTIVRRARLVWLRAGLDRAELFAAVERHALRAELALFSMPALILVGMALVLRPDLATGTLLYVATQIIGTTCFQYAGLTITRGWNVENILMFVGLCVLFLVMTTGLQPHRGAPVWAYLAFMAVFGGLTLALRAYASRAWRKLDWRVAGPMPLAVGWRRN